MKTKIILFFILTLCGFSAQAQMTDALGSLAIQGEIANRGYKAVNQGRRAVNRLQFQQDLASLISDIQITHLGNYRNISKHTISSRGIRGVDWDVSEDRSGGFIIILNAIDAATCFACQKTDFGARKVEISGNSCKSSTNDVKLYFQ